MTPSASNCRRWMPSLAADPAGGRWTCSSPIPAYESLEKHRAIGTTTRLKHSKSSSNDWFKIFPNARFGELFQRGLPRAQAQHALLPALRRRDDVRRQAGGGAGGLQVLEAAGVGQAHDRHGLPLPGALRVHPVLREGQAAAERPGHRRRDRRAAGPRRLPGGEAGGGRGGADQPELAARRARGRSVHGLGQRRRGRRAARPPVPGQRPESRGRADRRRSGCASSAPGQVPGRRHRTEPGQPDLLEIARLARHDRRRIRRTWSRRTSRSGSDRAG